jgi:uncharacterized protein
MPNGPQSPRRCLRAERPLIVDSARIGELTGSLIGKGGVAVTDAQATQTRATVQALYQAYREGNAERVAALIHDDIDWCIYGPSRVFAFEGPRRGKAQVMDVLAAIGRQFELKRYDNELLIVEGERAAVLSQVSFVQRATGRTLSMRLINFIRIRDGRIIEFREFSDTFDVVEQAAGAWLQVPMIPA